MSFTVLDGFNELARGAKRLPCRDGLRVKTGSTGIAEGRRTAKDMGVVCAVRGMSACAPLIPLRLDTPPVLETSQDFGLDGRASRRGLSCTRSETRPRSLDPPCRIQATNFGFQPRRVPRCRWRGIRRKKNLTQTARSSRHCNDGTQNVK